MHPLILALLFMLAALFGFSFLDGLGTEWVGLVMAGCIGYLFGQTSQLHKSLEHLRSAMAKDWEQRNRQNTVRENQPVIALETPPPVQTAQPTIMDAPKVLPASTPPPAKTYEPQPVTPSAPGFADKLSAYVKAYFTGGNLFVRIGILVLFVGVSFLLKLVSEKGLLPIEYRLAGVAAGAVLLLGFGWRLRNSKPVYALLLQGAAIGVLYLDVFAAFSLYGLIPSGFAFGLLFVISMLAAALAVLQDAHSLAMLGFCGGFIAPLLVSSGSGNYVGLFSYYAILNVAIAVIAWFKAWRPLNLLGFAFTFVIASLWGADNYTPDKFSTTEPFLVFFFLLYVGIAVLYALRQPPRLKGYVDGSLLFGVPLAASGLQYSMLKDTEYGVAVSALCMGVLYILLSRFVWRRKGEELRLLSEAFLALGVIFTSLAIPFALAPAHTAAAWALEGLGLLWLGSRQNRLSVRVFGMLLQAGAALFVAYGLLGSLFTSSFRNQYAFINAAFISTSLMAIAGVGSAWLLQRVFAGRRGGERIMSPLFLLWGLGWLYGGFLIEFDQHLDGHWLLSNLLLLSAFVSLGFGLWALKSRWLDALRVAFALLPVMALLFLPMLDQPARPGGWLVWPLAFAVLYGLYFRKDKTPDFGISQSWYDLWHSGTFLLLLAWITVKGFDLLDGVFADVTFVLAAWVVLPALAGWWWLIRAGHWPLSLHRDAYQRLVGRVLAAYLLLWVIVAVISSADVSPLPWLPLFNPADSLSVIVLISLFHGWRSNRAIFPAQADGRYLLAGAAALLFLWLNTTLFRVAHHWGGIPYRLDMLLENSFVQTAISVLWALTGVLVTVFASRRQWRKLWIAGSILLGIVVLKLFLVDLSQLGSLARVLSFMIVGSLMISIGYFAPLPTDKQTGETVSDET